MEFVCDRLKDKNPDGSLQIMYTIHGLLTFCSYESPPNDASYSRGEDFP
jgi:hypothetical protein